MSGMETCLLTKKGREKFAIDGHMYNLDKLSRDGQKKIWRCDQRCVQKCPARLHTDLTCTTVLQKMHSHNHGSDAALVEVAKIKVEMKRRATESLETPDQILESILSNTGLAIKVKMPNRDAARKMVKRARSSLPADHPAAQIAPIKIQDLDISQSHREYEIAPDRQEPFLLADVAYEENLRLLIFGRQSNIKWSDEMKELVIDSSFNGVPPLFEQVYVISAKREGSVVPVLYALLPNKLRVTYNTLYATVKTIWPQLCPTSIATNLEANPVNSIQDTFPEASIQCCLFHLVQDIQFQLTKAGLIANYINDLDFETGVKMITALAFIPVQDLDETFETLARYLLDNKPELEPILDWFEDNYLGRPIFLGGRRAALFEQVSWSLYQRVFDSRGEPWDQTETCHNRLKTLLSASQMFISKFVDALKTLQKETDLLGEQLQEEKCALSNTELIAIIQSYPTCDRLEYLRAIACNSLMT